MASETSSDIDPPAERPAVTPIRRLRRPMAGWVALTAYALVLGAAGTGLMVQYQDRLNHQIDLRQTRLRTGGDVITTTARVAAAEIDALGTAAAQAMDRPPVLRLPFLRENDRFEVPPGPGMTGRLTGRLPDDPSTMPALLDEMAAVATIEPFVLGALRQLPESAWIYYMSARRFLLLYPFDAGDAARYSDALMSAELMVRARPDTNPTGRTFWTAPYEDLGGKGRIVSIVRPVIAAGATLPAGFRGVIGIDLTEQALARMLDDMDLPDGTQMLIDEAGHVIALSARGGDLPAVDDTGIPDQIWPDRIWQAAGGTGDLAARMDAQARGVLKPAGAAALFHTRIAGTPWSLIHIDAMSGLKTAVLTAMWPEALATLLLMMILGAFESHRRMLRRLSHHRTALALRVEELDRARQDLAAARDEAEAANLAKTAFLAHMSHELRTPLNAVIGMAETLKAEVFGPLGPKQMEYAGDIAGAGSHLLELINDLLDLARIEAGEATLDEETVSVDDIVRPVIAIVSARARKAGHVLHLMTPSRPVTVSCDSRKMRQVLINLLTNAVKFTPDGGRISLVARLMPDRALALTVTDNGRGMDTTEIPRALEPFKRIDMDPMVRRQEGTGLGLSIVASFVKLHDGQLEIRSAPGAGTSVTVLLPAARIAAGGTVQDGRGPI
ncbi:ATP-binding protein [uncultured Tistrella sp.]|uniref:sensor histidine kinase n=1 Tax=Tistrella mobilis TaxID=171437 RepID=UPI000C0AC201|nr:ATP-binding protein [uncultured Tistrella sp.]MAM74533.1 Signal transduction histidine kinase [Tistrella sp.]